ncbi:aminopeptidase [Ottowia sp. GY511]|uniref:Aminopeptidase n=1 Tax=Ottowia flava TaxID=2675430 RepID=A0ABW4KQ93_9BURK|nr:aminopeptidase [Ottowia sp. GY511]TXK32990.1 aminopeptidase [Ottowia sp. GY511]
MKRRAAWVLLAVAGAWLLSGCTAASYYAQSIQGHLALMGAAKPVEEVLADPATPDDLRQRLELAKRIRAFAVTDLALPDNASYHRYSDLKRRAAVWNVAAAPPDSLTLKRWCFPVVGCVGYRGYYDEAEARALAEQLQRDEGLEVRVYGIPAYSTLGWLNWMGGDPLLSTFIRYPEGELARMIFHELAHQVVYVDDDTMFNESYATAVERLGGQRWLATHASEAARREYAAFDQRRRDFRALSRLTRDDLNAVYKQKGAPGIDTTVLAAMKEEAVARFRQRYADLKARWAAAGTPYDGYDRWVAEANNAFFGVQAAYDELVPAFEALFVREGSDWPRFHAAVAALGKLPKAERLAQLRALETATAQAGQDDKTTR